MKYTEYQGQAQSFWFWGRGKGKAKERGEVSTERAVY
jgi:hypothetical protein